MSNVEICEVGPRDGLQSEARLIPTADKVALIDRLSGVGFRRIEVASFISPRWVPQMADSAEVVAQIARAPGVRYTALAPNLRGFERARAAGVDGVAVFASASEGFSQANLNCSIAESLARYRDILWVAQGEGIPVRRYVSSVTDCPFDGRTPPGEVARVAEELHEMGCHEISLGDTLGHGTPESIDGMLRAVMEVVPVAQLAGHFHDTGGRALTNIDAALEAGWSASASVTATSSAQPELDTSTTLLVRNVSVYDAATGKFNNLDEVRGGVCAPFLHRAHPLNGARRVARTRWSWTA